MRKVLSGLVATCWLGVAVSAQEAAPPPDLLTLARGAVLVSAPRDPGRALALTDGQDGSHWNTAVKKVPPPFSFVFELIAPVTLDAVGVDGAGERPGGVQGGSVGGTIVEGSAEGPDRGWVELARLRAAPEGPTLAEVAPGPPMRWLRFTVTDAISPDATWIYFDEVIAHGAVAPPEDPDRFTGVFQSGRADFIELHQDGTELSGCYVENSGRSTGRLTGAVVDGVALLTWRSEQGIEGSALLTRDSAGALAGVRYRQRSRSAWGGPVAPEGSQTPCSPKPAAAAAPEPQVDPIVQALQEIGAVRLYGIHFEHDSDVPKPSATPALTRLLAALESAPGLNIVIEGHTDADGSEAYNLDLSQRRAASVVRWLTERGIDAARLLPEGKGEAQPVASNDTADGKALNRRVELRRR